MNVRTSVVCAEIECGELWEPSERPSCPKCGSSEFFWISKALNREKLVYESERVIHDQEEFPVAAI